MQISIEQIKKLAPDEKSVLAANQLTAPRLWESPGFSEEAVWGICGGGRNYQVQVDLSDMGSRCNCPSRKFPCKHVLALLMLFASVPDAFSFSAPPEWVSQWIEKRRAKRQQQLEKKNTPQKTVDKESQAKRVHSREANILQGIEQLVIWMDDIIRNGLAALESKPFSFWDTQARRLVDAQATGLASRIRSLAEIPGSSPDWPQRLLHEFGRTRLLLHAYQRLDFLSPNLQADVRQLIGWTISQAALDAHGDIVKDDWYIIGQRIEEQERFRLQRSWAIGLQTHRAALILQFVPGKQTFPELILPGTLLNGQLQFYPGAVPHRAKILDRTDTNLSQPVEIPCQPSIMSFLDEYAERLALNPWHAIWSCLLKDVTLSQFNHQWSVRDESGHGLPLRMSNPFEMLAVTGGSTFQIHGEWNGTFLTPLSYLFREQLIQC